jgi:integrase
LKNRKRKGAYPAGELHLLRFYLSTHDDRMALDACAALGLRRREVAALQAGDVNLTATTFAVKQPDGTWVDRDLPPGYAGVVSVRKGKGGRPRQAPVPEWYHFMLADLVARAPSKHTRLWPVSARLFGYEVLAACRRAEIPSRGIHGLRHFWALQQYWHLRGLGRDDLDARQLVSWWLGHNRIQVTVNYIPRQPAPSSCVYGSYRE